MFEDKSLLLAFAIQSQYQHFSVCQISGLIRILKHYHQYKGRTKHSGTPLPHPPPPVPTLPTLNLEHQVRLFFCFFFPEKRQKRLYIASYSRYPKSVKLSEETCWHTAIQTIYPIKSSPVRKRVSHKSFFPSYISLPYTLCEKSLKTPTTYLKKPKFQQLLLTTF